MPAPREGCLVAINPTLCLGSQLIYRAAIRPAGRTRAPHRTPSPEHRRPEAMQSAVNALAFPVPDKAWSVALLRRRSDLVLLRTASGETTACVHVHSKAKRRRRMTLLYSHANAARSGIGPALRRGAREVRGRRRARVRVLGLFLGVGRSVGAGVHGMYDAPAYRQARRHRPKADHCVWAVDRQRADGRPVRPASWAAILQSPIASAGLWSCLPRARALSTFDLFRNYEKISSVTCRSLLMHGRDKIFAHSRRPVPAVDPHAPVSATATTCPTTPAGGWTR